LLNDAIVKTETTDEETSEEVFDEEVEMNAVETVTELQRTTRGRSKIRASCHAEKAGMNCWMTQLRSRMPIRLRG